MSRSTNMRASNVLDQVVARGHCSGCGLCAGVAPHCLSVRLSEQGEYQPAVSACTECGLCLKVCHGMARRARPTDPFSLGDMPTCFVGHSAVAGERQAGASGGLATRLLKALLERREVDGVIAPLPTGLSEPLFAPAILRSAQEIDRAARSKYYPIEFSQVLRQLKANEGRYAIVGLPCAVTGFHRARREIAWMQDRLRYLFGLTCGQGVSAHYTTALAHLSGLREAPVAVEYRSKRGSESAANYRFVAEGTSGRSGRPLAWNDGPSRIWEGQLFTLDACFACSDLFAADADITFMDAWLPEYLNDPRGTSIVVVRSPELRAIIENERACGRVALSAIDAAEVLKSQAGALARKQQNARTLATGEIAPEALKRKQRAYFWKRALRGTGARRRIGLSLLQCYLSALGLRDLSAAYSARLQRIGARRTRQVLRLLHRQAETKVSV